MADDLVAELTLRLQNQMSAGLAEIRSELSTLTDPLIQLTTAVGELDSELAALAVPTELPGGFAGVADGANNAVAAVDAIGSAIDADTAKLEAFKAAWSNTGAGTFLPPSAQPGEPGYVPPFIPPGTTPPDEPQEPEPEPGPDDDHKKSGGHGAFDNPIMDFFAVATGYESFKQYADFQQKLNNIALTEHLHDGAADVEENRVSDLVQSVAIQYKVKADDLLSAYNYLITTGMKASEVDALLPGLAEVSTAHGIDVSDMQGAVMALSESYKISPDQMGAVLSQLGYATKMGHFSAESFGAFLPQIGGALSAAGDSGPDSADYTFAALESIIKNVSIPSEAATDYTDFIHYIGTQHAERSFLQRSRMMLPEMRDIFSKYDIKDADLWGMQDAAVAEGKDPIATVLDFVHNATKNMTPTDRNAVISDYFTNQQGGDAVRALMQYWNPGVNPDGTADPGFQANYQQLRSVTQHTLDDDFHTAIQNAATDLTTFDNNISTASRMIGQAFDYGLVKPANAIWNPQFGQVPVEGRAERNNPSLKLAPMELHVTVTPAGHATVTPRNLPPGSSVRVNQGQVLGNP